MNVWYAKGAVIVASIVMTAIRAPHGQRSRGLKVTKTAGGLRERAVLIAALSSFVVPLIWIASPWLAFADYTLFPIPFAAGVLCLAVSLWLFHRSHADLGTNWSVTLQVREQHRLVTTGVYEKVRHPMYLALLLYSAGQALVLPNWIAGPSYLVAMTVLFAARLGPEEQMMTEQFGAEYEAYRARTKRLLPGVW